MEEHVVACGLAPRPSPGDSCGVLLAGEYSTFLSYRLPENSGFDKKTNEVVAARNYWAVVRFERCLRTEFGHPNDEALNGHRLFGKGLRAYEVFEILNSAMIENMLAVNRVAFPKTNWEPLRHFVFTFHDSTFECVAKALSFVICEDPYEVMTRGLRDAIGL